ncbi:MAG: hypothetical protein GTO71_04800 [Woeseiaceae bacterium]|nr:hypothetical protein [Woeseiaceae bacterium]NIP20417.1 hypothetical protein [Woeseiaceae bacterium]NIS89306.1 hypothetical protein [Woeseiaceae bacterium]
MTKLKQANQWVSLATNVAVVAGLIVLIVEINQNTVALENQIDVAIYADAPIVMLAEHPDLAELHVRSESEAWDSFSPVEQERLSALWALSLDSAELQFRLRQRGSEQLTAENMVFPQRLLNRDSFRTFWREAEGSGVLDPEFVTFFNTYMMKFGN